MLIHSIINHPVDSTCFIVASDSDSTCIVVDPGTQDCQELFRLLDDRSLVVQYIYLSHEHIDHIIGCKRLKELFPQAKLVCSANCAKRLNNTRYNLSRFAEQFVPIDGFPEPEITFDDSITITWNGVEVLLHSLPGHSEGSSIMKIGNDLFVGDTFIFHFKTTSTLPGSSRVDLIKAFTYLLTAFTDNSIIVHPGHFEQCTLAEMKLEIVPQLEKIKKLVAIKGK